ncbi:hypothetical protein BpHYR1_046794 [Brachionus plicatilis]|uniref:Uncharacterized protein n=1 Tax=Brachionus plicatilis TaxID=10195 RepID=A0A3M7QQP9_BRAPC|nr:hypothetical protein BpHYR1_046794 [Brachionus plicatilis]
MKKLSSSKSLAIMCQQKNLILIIVFANFASHLINNLGDHFIASILLIKIVNDTSCPIGDQNRFFKYFQLIHSMYHLQIATLENFNKCTNIKF